MKRFPIRSLTVLAVLASASAAMALPTYAPPAQEPLGRMRKVDVPRRWSGIGGENDGIRKSASHSTPQSDEFQYIYGPDGSIWYATAQYDTETVELEGGFATEDLIKGYTFTVYDSKFNEIGSIHDDIRLEGDEYKCARVMLDVTITQKFFNLDARYEAMVAVCMNMPDYSVSTRTMVYSIGGERENGCDKVLMTIPGYAIDAVDTATDPWGENYFISFLTEHTPDPEGDYPDYMSYLAEFGQVVTTYKKAGMNPEPSVVNVHEVKNLMLPGDQMSSPMLISKSDGGKLTLVFSQYEKSFFVDPTGMGDDDGMTPDNSLQIDVYQLPSNSSSEMNLISSTRIPADQELDNPDVFYTFYGIGTFRYDKDVDYGHYTADGSPAFVVTIDKYLLSDDDRYRSSYVVYDSEGNILGTLAADTYNYIELSDVPGEEPQVMFVYKGETQMTFEFVDLYSCNVVTSIDQVQDGFVLSGSVDRVPTAGGYHYAISYAQGISDDEGDMHTLIGWFGQDGMLERVDNLNVGKDVQLAQVYIEANALSPYVFNTDTDLEYMVLVKRGMGEDDANLALTEELMIVAPGREPVCTFLPEEEKGRLASIFLFGESERMLVLTYIDTHRICADAYELPFTRFQGGEGTAASPYLVATAGDLLQMASFPSAHFRLVNDLDCAGERFFSVHDFTGSLDGAGHTIYNLGLAGSDNTSLFASAFRATFKDLNFYNASMYLEGGSDAALLVGTATMCEIDNVNVRRLTASGDDFRGTFGGIAGHLWSTSKLTRSAVTYSVVRLPQAETVGGVVSEMRTGSVVDACLFTGNIDADNTVGGIAGSTTTGDETISDCRVSANIAARNTVGGVVGYLNRSKVKNNFVEGFLAVSEPSKWTKALSLGGIAGELHADWEGTANVPVVNNVVALDCLSYPALDIAEDYPHQTATVHRVVGRTSYNEEPEITGTNPDGTPVYKDPLMEGGILSNLVINTLPTVDTDFSETSMEGTSVDRDGLDAALLGQYGFAFGDTVDRPWLLTSPGYMKLFFEKSLFAYATSYNVKVDHEFDVLIEVIDASNSDVTFTYPEELLELEEMYDMEGEIDGTSSSTMRCYRFYALKEGDATITATMGDETVECMIHIEGYSKVESVEDEITLRYENGLIQAPGCDIEIYSLAGIQVKKTSESVDATSLPTGTYVAIARTSGGETKILKFRR